MDTTFNPNDYPTYQKRPALEPKTNVNTSLANSTIDPLKKTVFPPACSLFYFESIFFTSERINHYDQTYLHSRYH